VITIDQAGRIVVPKSIRDALNLQAGSSLEIELQGDAIVLRPPKLSAVMNQKNGFWVFNTGGQITPEMVDEALADAQGRAE
jgi:AbrB family looped-hinge helix DNA binding protein